jgi:hypothetical protein
MATIYSYPTTRELKDIEPGLILTLTGNDPVLRMFPARDTQAWEIRWTQRDNYLGMQQVRGLGGPPPRVTRVGQKEYRQEPGVYGEHIALEERELTTRAAGFYDLGVPININDLVTEAQNQLIQRQWNRIR